MASSDLSSSISNITSRIQGLTSKGVDIQNDLAAQAALLQLSQELLATVQSPNDIISSMAYSGVRNATIRTSIDLGLFDILSADGPVAVAEVASKTGAETELILRLLRALDGMGFAKQVDTDSFAATPVSRQMTLPNIQAGVRFFFDQGGPIMQATPESFKNNGYRLPRDMTDGPSNFAHRSEKDSYTFWSEQPGVTENFNTFMRGRFGRDTRLNWSDWFPLNDVCLDGFDSHRSEFFFVDVGGGRGHECEKVLAKYPGLKGRFVLQDLANVVDDTEGLDPRIEKMAHDFTKPQPIKGARTYLLKSVFHNWPFSVCQIILSQLREAMIPRYSRILIVNMILSDMNVSARTSEMDMAMLYMHSGAQRNANEWTRLVKSAGMEVVKFWYPPGDGDGVIEVQAV